MSTLVNARFLSKPVGGVARVGREMLRALLEELAARSAGERPEIEIAAPPGVALEGVEQAGAAIVAGPGNLVGEQLMLPLVRPGATILSFANSTPLLAWRSIIWIHDAHVFEAPESYSAAYRLWHQNLLRACVLRGFQVITVSNYSREALIEHGANADRTAVIWNGGDHILRAPADVSVADAQGLTKDSFVLLVGSRAKHKNLPFAVQALSQRLPREVTIAVVGLHQEGAYSDSAGVGADARVRLLPVVSDAQLRALYERARAVVIPSVLEGFGLPAAEALWCSAPLVLANRTALPEVGGDAALYFEPDDGDALAACVLQSFEGATRALLLQAGATQRQKFRWRASAKKLVDEFLTER